MRVTVKKLPQMLAVLTASRVKIVKIHLDVTQIITSQEILS